MLPGNVSKELPLLSRNNPEGSISHLLGCFKTEAQRRTITPDLKKELYQLYLGYPLGDQDRTSY
jgi:hypothetical protein